MQPMLTPSHDTPKNRSRSGPIAALILVAVLVLYPLSIGPAAWAVEQKLIPQRVEVFYEPLGWLIARWPLVAGRAVIDYRLR